jgi:4,5-DOPA dioxygenase extradiol
MPAIFFGHGNPMYAIQPNRYADAWRSLAASIPRPRAIVAISAHWFVRSTRVTAMDRPRTIHDFGGFPDALYQLQYPAPGSPELAQHLIGLLGPATVADTEWGFDHGVWAVLRHLYPAADIPVVALSLDRTLPAATHAAFGNALGALRDEGVLIMGSGNVSHNLGMMNWEPDAPPFGWAQRFEDTVSELAARGDVAALAAYHAISPDAALAVPTPEHYLPLLYVLGAARAGEPISFPVRGIDAGSISMLCVQAG